MLRFSRPAVLVIFLLIPAVLVPHTTTAQTLAATLTHIHVSAPVSPASYPTGESLLRQSLAAMRRSLHSSHGAQTTTSQSTAPRDTAQHETTTFQLIGTCALTHSSLAANTTASSRLSTGPSSSVEYVVIASPHASHTWTRSAQTHKQWLTADFARIELGILEVCPSIFLRDFLRDFAGKSFANLGLTTVGGHSTWHLHTGQSPRGQVYKEDFYLDQRSLYPVRAVFDQVTTSSHFHMVTQFTAFNVPVRISPPASSSAPPAQGLGPDVNISVTPNPMPGNSTPALTVTATPGSHCTARVEYPKSGSGSGSSITQALGTRRVGTSGTVRWTWHIPARAVDGIAIAECPAGSIGASHTASFYVFS